MNKHKKIADYVKGGVVNSLMVMCTYACQLACNYCEVKQSTSFMPLDNLYKAIDLLLTTQSKECQLRFWGGEPLLRWEFIRKGILYGEQRAREKDKKIRFMITTNGLLLDKEKIGFLLRHPAEIMFSLDGDKETNKTHRFSKSGQDIANRLFLNLKLLVESGLPYFINMVVTPKTVINLSKNLRFLKSTDVKRTQLCYQCGILWPPQKIDTFIRELKKFITVYHEDGFLMNLLNDCEPTMLSQELLVDINGKIYFDAAIFVENKFPDLRSSYLAGTLDDVKTIDSLYHTKKELFFNFSKSCSKQERIILSNNIDLGLRLDNFLKSFSAESIDSNEHPQIIPIVKGDFFSQKNFLDSLNIDSLYLYIEGSCANNCIFCKHKEEKFSDLFRIEAKLNSNLKIKAKKLCIIGNEPLLHPDILEIVSLAKVAGFKKIEIMTSGECLSDNKFVEKIIDRGVTSFSLPLFADEKKVHDSIVGREGSFLRITKGVRNVINFKTKVFIHTNLINQNINYILDLEKFVKKELKLPFVVLPVRPKTANLPFKNLMPAYGEIVRKSRGIDSLMGFPLCVVKKVQKKIIKSFDEISDSMKLYLLDQKFTKAKICKRCFYFDSCLGLFKEYLQLYTLDEIKPL